MHAHEFGPIKRDILDNLCQLWANKPGFVKLGTHHARRNSRFTLLAHSPTKTFICDQNQQFDFDELRSELDAHINCQKYEDALSSSLPLPFYGGYLLLLGYDLAETTQIDATPAYRVQKKRVQALPDAIAGWYEFGLIYDHKASTLTAAGYNLSVLKRAVKDIEADLKALQGNVADKKTFEIGSWLPAMSRAEYAHAFNQIQTHLQQGDCYQINLTQPFTATISGDTYAYYEMLEKNNAAPFSGFYKTDFGAVMSLSPERFFSLTADGVLRTEPIKGTMPRSADSAQDLKNQDQLKYSKKDFAENLMITDLLRNDLGKVSKTGSVDVKRLCELQSFEAVHHLVTTIESELKDSLDIFDVLKAVFPGGSITGAPKISAMKIIRDIEPYPRGFYCGSMGYISAHGASDFNIMIRTVTQLGDKLSCHGGGGITVLSDCASEYQECLDKIQKIILSNAGC